jgi:hypothetical protein
VGQLTQTSPPSHPPFTSSLGSKHGSAAGGDPFTDTRSHLSNKGAQGVRIGRTSEHKGPKTEVGRQMLQHLDPVVDRTNDRSIAIAGRTHSLCPARYRCARDTARIGTVHHNLVLAGVTMFGSLPGVQPARPHAPRNRDTRLH